MQLKVATRLWLGFGSIFFSDTAQRLDYAP